MPFIHNSLLLKIIHMLFGEPCTDAKWMCNSCHACAQTLSHVHICICIHTCAPHTNTLPAQNVRNQKYSVWVQVYVRNMMHSEQKQTKKRCLVK